MGTKNENRIIEQRGPFRVLDRTVESDAYGMQVIKDDVRRSDGTQGIYRWVKFARPAVEVYPFDSDNNVYLAKHYTYGTNDVRLEAAGGSMEVGETPQQTARREIREELGVEVRSLQHIQDYQDTCGRVDNKTIVYAAQVESVAKANPETGEDITLEKMPFPLALELVRRGGINTTVVVAALWQIHDLKQRGELFSDERVSD